MRGEMNSTGLRFQTDLKTSSAHMKFHFDCTSKRPDILMDMRRHFISGSVYMIFYHPKWNFISVKMTDMKSIPALSFKCTCALNTTSNESAVTFIASRVNYVHMRTSCTGIRNYGTRCTRTLAEHRRNNRILAEQSEYHGIVEHVKSSGTT